MYGGFFPTAIKEGMCLIVYCPRTDNMSLSYEGFVCSRCSKGCLGDIFLLYLFFFLLWLQHCAVSNAVVHS